MFKTMEIESDERRAECWERRAKGLKKVAPGDVKSGPHESRIRTSRVKFLSVRRPGKGKVGIYLLNFVSSCNSLTSLPFEQPKYCSFLLNPEFLDH